VGAEIVFTPLHNLTNVDLVRRVRTGQFSSVEMELAERLGAAIDEIERLVQELKTQTAKEMRDDAGG
jgi:hypothetical protein